MTNFEYSGVSANLFSKAQFSKMKFNQTDIQTNYIDQTVSDQHQLLSGHQHECRSHDAKLASQETAASMDMQFPIITDFC